MRAHLIGGPQDGQIIAVDDDLQIYKVAGLPQFPNDLAASDDPLPSQLIIHRYVRHKAWELSPQGVEEAAVFEYQGEQ